MLQKLQRGSVDAIKSAQLLLDQEKISVDIILLFDEMYIQKDNQYQAGKMIGANESGELYNGVVSFMIVGLKQSVPMIVKAEPECTITGEWLIDELEDSVAAFKSRQRPSRK